MEEIVSSLTRVGKDCEEQVLYMKLEKTRKNVDYVREVRSIISW